MRARWTIMLSASLMGALLAAPARADGYLTARGLYDDCSAGARPGLDLERQEQRRKCQNFLRAVAADWVRSFPAEALPADPIACPRSEISAWEAEYGPGAKEAREQAEAAVREAIGGEAYERIEAIGSAGGPLRRVGDAREPGAFLEYWDGRGFGLLGGFTSSARSAVLEYLDATMVICSPWRIIRPVDPKELAQ